jgi:hypothetical protein
MKRIKSKVIGLAAVGLLGAGSYAWAADGVLYSQELTPGTYCHIKFPAISEESINSNKPLLKDSSSGDVIDFYGPCDESPTGKDQVAAQRFQDEIYSEHSSD